MYETEARISGSPSSANSSPEEASSALMEELVERPTGMGENEVGGYQAWARESWFHFVVLVYGLEI